MPCPKPSLARTLLSSLVLAANLVGLVSASISPALFRDLERHSRIVDITYCIGNSGIRKPFECISRCNDFPELSLVTTWSTGLLLTDSCGYIAVDHGRNKAAKRPGENEDENAKAKADENKRQLGAIVVAFRGTYSIRNTIVDLSTLPQQYVPYPPPDDGGQEPAGKPENRCDNCTVHMGFLQSWQSARDIVLPELKALRAKHPSYPIHLVGHSLGGAVACLAGLEIKTSLGWDDIKVTTFGEPRVGNHELARFIDTVFALDDDAELESRSFRRVTHSRDPVPLLPWGEWGYRSHAGEIYISKPDLSPTEVDMTPCIGDNDPACITDGQSFLHQVMSRWLHFGKPGTNLLEYLETMMFPMRIKPWQLFFAHRDYFWRLGLCVPGGDPTNWGRSHFTDFEQGEL
ncbi:hypothetical protein DCS_07357 [Drechmeria coniospora]|uniref:Fungal lipase-type domain-containing protein n=1 Tax=Drechmeria coniospora TaxID=98403 RepID=A0A151GE76_DRECN|nr:hypothetical protein DCS_07357 [Drechmeria coniospora]KYK55394.1 hypothetical protein DCS_07357 [Drechmeria coniospora]